MKIKPSERLALIGTTGSGKSFLAARLLTGLKRAVVIDPKHTFKLEGYKPGKRLPLWSNEYRLIYRPAMNDDSAMAGLLFELWKRGNVVIYIDELQTLTDLYPLSTRALENIARTGREKKISLWAAMQRPRWVPRIFLTESEVLAVFLLRAQDDRKYISGFGGPEMESTLPEFGFWYIRPGMVNPIPLKLEGEKFIQLKEVNA